MDMLTATAQGLLLSDDTSANILLDWLSPRIDDEMLLAIASADYGMDTEEHFAALRRIREDRDILHAMEWHPREVLELTRWSEPDDPATQPVRQGLSGHLLRAFACAVLLRLGAIPENHSYLCSENETLAQLLASSLALGSEAHLTTARFLAWRVEHFGVDRERPFLAFGLLFLVVLLGQDRFPEDGILELAECVLAEEARVRQAGFAGPFTSSQPWLLGLTSFNQRHEVWLQHATRLLAEARRVRCLQLRFLLELIASSMLEE